MRTLYRSERKIRLVNTSPRSEKGQRQKLTFLFYQRTPNMIPLISNQLLNINLLLPGLPRKGDVDSKLPIQFFRVLFPFFLVKVIPVAISTPVEEIDRPPVGEGVLSILGFRFTRQRNSFLNESSERSDSLKKEKSVS